MVNQVNHSRALLGNTWGGHPAHLVIQQVGHSICIAQQAGLHHTCRHVFGQELCLLADTSFSAWCLFFQFTFNACNFCSTLGVIQRHVERSSKVITLNQGSQASLGQCLEHGRALLIRGQLGECLGNHRGELLTVELTSLGHLLADLLDQVVHLSVGFHTTSQILHQTLEEIRLAVVHHSQGCLCVRSSTGIGEHIGHECCGLGCSLQGLALGLACFGRCSLAECLRFVRQGVGHPVVGFAHDTHRGSFHTGSQVLLNVRLLGNHLSHIGQGLFHILAAVGASQHVLHSGQRIVAESFQLLVDVAFDLGTPFSIHSSQGVTHHWVNQTQRHECWNQGATVMCVHPQSCASTEEILLIRRELAVQRIQCLGIQLVACLCNGRCDFGLSAQCSNHLSKCQALCRSLQESSSCSIRRQITGHGRCLERFSGTANCFKHRGRCRHVTTHSLLECFGHDRSLCVVWRQSALCQRVTGSDQQILHTTAGHVSLSCRNHFHMELHLAQDVIGQWALYIQPERAEHHHAQEADH